MSRKGRFNRSSQSAPTTRGTLPDVVGGSKQAPSPNVRPDPVFWLAAHPARIEIFDGRLLPAPMSVVALPGVNGMDVTSKGKPSPSHAFAHLAEQGFTVIPWDPADPYLVQIESHGGWISKWEKVFPGSSQRRTDVKAYADWLEAQVEAGTIEEPAAYAVEALRETILQTIDQYAKRVGSERQVKHQTARLAVVDAWLADVIADDGPASPSSTTPGLPDVVDAIVVPAKKRP